MPDSLPRRIAMLAALFFASLASFSAQAEKKTVCTITVNSADEKDAFRRSLPAEKYDFVELVEHGRPDWLESACRRGVKCDMLVISGHYDGGNEFFSDRVEAKEFLPVAELERASCSASCPGIFSQLKEVYLFGCNSLNPEAVRSVSAEVGRSLARAGYSRTDADRLARALATRHGESSKGRMREIFRNVPAIYGFSSVAPLGSVAGPLLQRYFQSAGPGEIGTGKVSGRLLNQFAAHSLVATSGIADNDPLAAHRRDVCEFADDGSPVERKVEFVHSLLNRQMAEVRMFLDRLERWSGELGEQQRTQPAVAAALGRIAGDDAAKMHFLDFARDADEPAVRARMVELAGALGWLGVEQQRTEVVAMINQRLASGAVTAADVDLVCALNKDGDLDQERGNIQIAPAMAQEAAPAAVLACLGSEDAHLRVLQALTSTSDNDVRIAQVYLRHRPLDDVAALREITSGIARMSDSVAQTRALHALSSYRLSDRDSLVQLARLYPLAETPGVQSAIAGVLLRSEYQVIASPELVRTLQDRRLRGGATPDVIDVLIRRMQAL